MIIDALLYNMSLEPLPGRQRPMEDFIQGRLCHVILGANDLSLN